jgi:DNA replication factor GINS
MYSELYAAWQRETENPALQPLPADFYARVADYLKRIRDESLSADKKTLKASLLEREQRNVQRIVKELLRARYKKLVKSLGNGQKLPSDLLTSEEAEIFSGLIPFTEAYQAFARSLLQGQLPEAQEAPHKRVTLRFLKAIPAIVGSDMKTYGPFKAEDVGSVPPENAKILVKQGLAQFVEVS